MKKLGKMELVILVSFVAFVLTFSMGFMIGRKGLDNITFSREELERIVELQEIEDSRQSGMTVVAYKDADGKLMIGWTKDKNAKRR